MRRQITLLLAVLLIGPAFADGAVRVALIKTADAASHGLLTLRGGGLERVAINHTAVLVSHAGQDFLFDSGLGSRAPEQIATMPWWAKAFFAYGHLCPAADQLVGRPIPRIILSHGHWDHASGLADFPDAEVWVTAEERNYLAQGKPPAVLPIEVRNPATRWHVYTFEDKPAHGYPRSLDLFGDGSAVLVPLPGHTPGSVGLFTRLASGKVLFFVGDTIWQAEALDGMRDKAWLASRLVDNDPGLTHQRLRELAALGALEPELVIVPAHDAAVQNGLGYFPNWVDEPIVNEPARCPAHPG